MAYLIQQNQILQRSVDAILRATIAVMDSATGQPLTGFQAVVLRSMAALLTERSGHV